MSGHVPWAPGMYAGRCLPSVTHLPLEDLPGIDIRLLLTCAFASSVAKRVSGTSICILIHGEVQFRDFYVNVTINQTFLMLLIATALFSANPA